MVAPIRNKRDERNRLGLADLSGLTYLIILINGINEIYSI